MYPQSFLPQISQKPPLSAVDRPAKIAITATMATSAAITATIAAKTALAAAEAADASANQHYVATLASKEAAKQRAKAVALESRAIQLAQLAAAHWAIAAKDLSAEETPSYPPTTTPSAPSSLLALTPSAPSYPPPSSVYLEQEQPVPKMRPQSRKRAAPTEDSE